jgi:hypothetical protein
MKIPIAAKIIISIIFDPIVNTNDDTKTRVKNADNCRYFFPAPVFSEKSL